MKRIFYRLQSPRGDEPNQVHGESEWESRFSRAEWSENVVGLSEGRIALPVGSPSVDLTIVLPYPHVGDFVWTWYSDCIVTDDTLSLFRQGGFTGFEARPVTVERIKRLSRKRQKEIVVPPLWELLIKGQGGDAAEESGIHVIEKIEETGILLYSSFRNGIIVDEANWDGSDFFTVNGYPRFILVSERVKEFIIDHELSNCALIPSHELEWSSGIRPEEMQEKERAMAARDLSSLIADLESPDDSNWLDTIHALGEKGDPGAVHQLIRKFDHPDALIWSSAASAVAAIVLNKKTAEQARKEIFSKLCNLLGYEHPLVRKSAATALGDIGGEQAAEAVMRLLEDANGSVRGTGVFVIGRLRYKPALESVRRLTRDRNRDVRKTARNVLLELSSESS